MKFILSFVLFQQSTKEEEIAGDGKTGYILLLLFGSIFFIIGIVILLVTLIIKRKKDSLFPGLRS